MHAQYIMETDERITEFLNMKLNLGSSRKLSGADSLMTPPARENTEVDMNLHSDETEESADYITNDEWVHRHKLLDDDIPLDGISTDQSDFSTIRAEMETEKSELAAALEKIATRGDLTSAHQEDEKLSESDSKVTDTTYAQDDHENLDLTYSTEMYSPAHESEIEVSDTEHISNRSQRLTANNSSDLGVSTWHSSTCSMCTCGAITGTYTDTSTNENIHLLAHGETANKWLHARREGEKTKVQKFGDGDLKTRDTEDKSQDSSRNASRLALESREAMFQRAMTLLTTRCTSVRQGLNTADSKVPFGIQIPRYFYISQEKPTPMEPLKAWRGYNGNVYFEPLSIAHMKSPPKPVDEFESTPGYTERTSDRTTERISDRPTDRQRSFLGQKHVVLDKGDRPILDSRSESRMTKSSQSSMRPPVMLDKQHVISRFNESLQEDLVWLEGQDSTGSLAVRPKTQGDNSAKRDILYNKERLCKGSVVHKLFVENKTRRRPKLSVSGGKVTPPTAPSPLLRAQTQYSLSSQRLTTNSPDPYHVNDNKLPPVYQIRAGRQNNSAKRAKSYNRPVTVADMKPFVKYSPDVVVKFNTQQQANMA